MIQTHIFDYADLTKALRDCAETDCILAVTEYTTLTGETSYGCTIRKDVLDKLLKKNGEM